MERILCLAAHPDDEVLGCGATLAKHVLGGDLVEVVIAAEGITGREAVRDSVKSAGALSELQRTAAAANKALGLKTLHFLDLPDNRMDSVDLLDIVKKIEEIVNRFKPTVIYTHHSNDLNIDHRLLSQAVLTACRPQPGFSVKRILTFEVPSATHWNVSAPGLQFTPNHFVNITATLAQKLAALDIYKGEMREFPHARSIKGVQALAEWRGTTVGYAAAEAFELIRSLQD